jgi:hypothetical protein
MDAKEITQDEGEHPAIGAREVRPIEVGRRQDVESS